MLGLVFTTIFSADVGLHLVEQMQVRQSPAYVVAGLGRYEFKVVPSLGRPSIFIGLHLPDRRFDLTSDGIEVRQLGSKKLLWKRNAASAVVTECGVVALYENQIISYSLAGEVVSTRALRGHGVQWSYLDPNLKYALGFRIKPNRPGEWSLHLLDLTTQKQRVLPIVYDIGGHVDPSIRSFGRSYLIFDIFYAFRNSGAVLQKVDWLKLGLGRDSYIVDVHETEPLVIVSQVGSEERHIVDLTAERVVAKGLRSGSRFVKQSRTGDVFVWSWNAGTLQVYTLDR